MREWILIFFFLFVGCQVKTIQPASVTSKSQTKAVPAAGPAGSALIAGRVFPEGECQVHLEFLTVAISGPEPSGETVCTAPVTSTGRYEASCKLRKAEYAVQLRNTRDGRTLRSSRIDLRSSETRGRMNEIDFEACGLRTVELARPESVPGAPPRDESSLE